MTKLWGHAAHQTSQATTEAAITTGGFVGSGFNAAHAGLADTPQHAPLQG
jgi:hypothetical protein